MISSSSSSSILMKSFGFWSVKIMYPWGFRVFWISISWFRFLSLWSLDGMWNLASSNRRISVLGLYWNGLLRVDLLPFKTYWFYFSFFIRETNFSMAALRSGSFLSYWALRLAKSTLLERARSWETSRQTFLGDKHLKTLSSVALLLIVLTIGDLSFYKIVF